MRPTADPAAAHGPSARFRKMRKWKTTRPIKRAQKAKVFALFVLAQPPTGNLIPRSFPSGADCHTLRSGGARCGGSRVADAARGAGEPPGGPFCGVTGGERFVGARTQMSGGGGNQSAWGKHERRNPEAGTVSVRSV